MKYRCLVFSLVEYKKGKEKDDQPLYSLLLKKTYENVGITEYITKNNYLHLLKFADEATAAYLQEQLSELTSSP